MDSLYKKTLREHCEVRELLKERIHMLGKDNENVIKLFRKWKSRAKRLADLVRKEFPTNSGHASCRCPLCRFHREVDRIMGKEK
jgi:hypothetical protein